MEKATRARTPSGRPLTNRTLRAHAGRLAVPTYDRAALTPAVVHVGVGGFHRAHQAMYFDDLAEQGISTRWGVTGVGLRRPGMRDALAPQDCLYTVVERSASADAARVIGAIGRCLFAPDASGDVLAALCDERTQLVTLTITGNGYNVDPMTGAFDAREPAIRADLEHPERPTTVFGYVVEALARRRRAGLQPFTVLSCDNVPGNGAVARTACVSFAEMRDADLAAFIDRHVAFPSSMVDRITPATTEEARRELALGFGVADRWPVITEPFTQWIVEDAFGAARPPLDEVGAQFVVDVRPYELMKKRMLNAAHSALGYLGSLAGHRRTDDAMRDPVCRGYVDRLLGAEIAPLLPPVRDVDLDAYRAILLDRLANPRIGDRLARLSERGSTKMPAYLLPSVADALDRDRPHALLTLAVAGWLRSLRGVDDLGEPIDVHDARRETLGRLVAEGGIDPRPVLSERAVFGNLGDRPAFVVALGSALEALTREGARGAMAAAVDGALPLAA